MKKIFTELFEQFVKTNKREPKGMELIQLKFKANKLQREADKIIEFPRNKIQPLDPDDALPNYKETPGEYSRRNTPGSIENLREEMKIAYRNEFDRLTGNETAEELKEILKNLDEDGVPFAEGGSTSTGLNYLLGEDDTNSRVPYATGGRRGFLKLLAGLGAAGAAFKTGLLGLTKGAAKPAAKVAAEAATSGAPPHFLKLVAKIKALGDESTAKYATKDREVVTSYKDYTLTEDISTGEKTIQRFKDSEVDYYDEILMEETYMSHTPGKGQMDETTKGRMPPDEYIEDTSYLRTSGPQKGDILETVSGVSDDIFEEVGEKIPEIIRKEKADGGRMGYEDGEKVTDPGYFNFRDIDEDKFSRYEYDANTPKKMEKVKKGIEELKKRLIERGFLEKKIFSETDMMPNSNPYFLEFMEEENLGTGAGEATPEELENEKRIFSLKQQAKDGGRMGYAGGKKVVEGLISLLKKKTGKDVLTTADKIAIPKKTLDRDMFKKFNDKNPDPKPSVKKCRDDDYEI